MILKISKRSKKVTIELPLNNWRNNRRGGKATTIAGGEEQITAILDGKEETFRVRVSVDYHKDIKIL